MANTIFKDLTTKSAQLVSTDRVVSIWLGDSIIAGTAMAPTSTIIDPGSIYPATLTGGQFWDKWVSADRSVLSDGSFSWDDITTTSGGITSAVGYTPAFYGHSLYLGGSGAADFTANINHVNAVKHYTIVLGISGSSINDDLSVVSNPLAHWEPAVDNGAFELLTEHYIQPALSNLRAGGTNTVYLEGIYIHIGNDAYNGTTYFPVEIAQKYDIYLRRLIFALEQFLEFSGVPICILQTPQLPSDYAHAGIIRAAQARVAASRPRTVLMNPHQFPQGTDHIHFNAMGNIKFGYEAAQALRTAHPNQFAQLGAKAGYW